MRRDLHDPVSGAAQARHLGDQHGVVLHGVEVAPSPLSAVVAGTRRLTRGYGRVLDGSRATRTTTACSSAKRSVLRRKVRRRFHGLGLYASDDSS